MYGMNELKQNFYLKGHLKTFWHTMRYVNVLIIIRDVYMSPFLYTMYGYFTNYGFNSTHCNNQDKIHQSGIISTGVRGNFITFCTRKSQKEKVYKPNIVRIRSTKNYNKESLMVN